MLLRLLTLPVLGPIEGVVWIADQLLKEADRQRFGRDAVIAELAALHAAVASGEMDEELFLVREEALLDRLDEIEGEEDR
jgi:hypothetical protein